MLRLSIKLKVALATTALVLVLIGGLVALVLQSMRTEFETVLAAQQASLVERTAAELDNQLQQNLEILTKVAAAFPPDAIQRTDRLREYLSGFPALRVLFDDLLVLDSRGQVVADVPALPGRTQVNAADRDYFKVVMAEGRSAISQPVISKQRREPIVNMGAPIHDASGAIVGVLTGVLRLQKSNVLGDLASARVGERGYFVLLTQEATPRYVMHPDYARLLQPRVTDGSRPVSNCLRGERGTHEGRSSHGFHALFTCRSLQSTDWLLVAVLPSAEAFAPLDNAERTVSAAAILCALTIAPLVWLIVNLLLGPLSRLRASIHEMREAPESTVEIVTERDDEVGEVADALRLLIEQRSQAQRREAESESRFVAAADSSLDALFLFDASRDGHGHILEFELRYLNANARALIGIADERGVLGGCIRDLLPRADDPNVFARYTEVVESGAPLDLEFETHAVPKGARWLHEQAVRANDGIAVTIADVTQKRHDAESIQRQRVFLQTLLDHIPVGLKVRAVRGDKAGQVVIWNEADEAIYGIPAAQAIGKTASDLMPPSAAARIEASDRELLANQNVQDVIDTIDFPTLGRRTLRTIRAPVMGSDGHPEFIISITADITSDQERVDQLRLASKVFETTADAIVIADADDRIITVNAAFTKLTGFEANEMLGRILGESPFAPVDPEQSAARMQRQRRDGVVTAEVKRFKKDGTPLYLWVTASFVSDNEDRITHNIRVFTDISELKATQAKLEQMAGSDALTGLPNRRLFEDRISRALSRTERSGRGVILVYIDLDGFKPVNDVAGHAVGDEVLKIVAGRLVDCIRVADSVCRLGGDEFAVVLEDTSSPSEGEHVAERILAACTMPIGIATYTFKISASIGIACYPRDARTLAELVSHADAAMYRAKRAGGSRYVASDEKPSVVA